MKLDDSAAAEAFAKLAQGEEPSSKAERGNSNDNGGSTLAVEATAQDDGGVTALMLACDKGKPIVSKALLQAGADPWRSMWGTGNRPAHFAAGCHASSAGAVACLEALALCADHRSKGSKKVEKRKGAGVPPATASTNASADASVADASGAKITEAAVRDDATTAATAGEAKTGPGGRGTLVNVPGFEASFNGATGGSGDLASALTAAGVQVDYSTLQNVQGSSPSSNNAVKPKASAAQDKHPHAETGANNNGMAGKSEQQCETEEKPRGCLFVGADALNGHGDTPLMVAVAGGQIATATWLIGRMALDHQRASDNDVATAAAAAAAGVAPDAATPSSSSKSSSSKLRAPAANEATIPASPWLDALNFSGDSALSLAATHADPAVVDLLLQSGANPYCMKKATPASNATGSKSRKGKAGKSNNSVEGLTDGLTPKGADLVGSMLQELQSGQTSTNDDGSSSGSVTSSEVPARDALAAAEWAVEASAGSPPAVQAAAARCVELIGAARAAVGTAADALAMETALEAEKEMSGSRGNGNPPKSKSSKSKKAKKKGAAGKRAPSVDSSKQLSVNENDDEDDDDNDVEPADRNVAEQTTKMTVAREELTPCESASSMGDDVSEWIAPRSHAKAHKKGAPQPPTVAKAAEPSNQSEAATNQTINMQPSASETRGEVTQSPTIPLSGAKDAERSAFDALVAKACFGRKSRSSSLGNNDEGNGNDDDDVSALVATLGLSPADLWLDDPRALALQLSPTQLSCAGQLLAERVAAVQDARVIQARMAALAEARNEALNEAELHRSGVKEDEDHRHAALAVEPTSTPAPPADKCMIKEVVACAPWLNAPAAEPVD